MRPTAGAEPRGAADAPELGTPPLVRRRPRIRSDARVASAGARVAGIGATRVARGTRIAGRARVARGTRVARVPMRIRDDNRLIPCGHGRRRKSGASRHGDDTHGDHSFLNHPRYLLLAGAFSIALIWDFAPPLRMAARGETHAIVVYIGGARKRIRVDDGSVNARDGRWGERAARTTRCWRLRPGDSRWRPGERSWPSTATGLWSRQRTIARR